ncbi:hypothetical protein V494_01965 [Pseudogymnoascus sp. VKM F-4513 (FW-928)]|nr:hypothetical protein V494_01965 [Pseudogymnoascus sp. VKM F-4513 (FW-928)]
MHTLLWPFENTKVNDKIAGCLWLPLAAKTQLVSYPPQAGCILQEEKMERDIAGHGSRPLKQKAQEEGIYASFMPTDMIVTRLDQGLTLPPKIHPETLADNGESHMESTSKEQATKDSTSDAHDHHLIDNLSQENSSKNTTDCTNKTQQKHTGKVYDPCQHIELNIHHRHEKLTDGPSSFPNLGKKQQGFYSSSGAPDHASRLVLELVPELVPEQVTEDVLARNLSASCQGSIDSEPANQLQLAPINGNISSIWLMDPRAMPGSSGPFQETVPQTQKPKRRVVEPLCNRDCITVIDKPVATKHVTALQRDELPCRGVGNRGSELTISYDNMVEEELPVSVDSMVEKLSVSESISATPESDVNIADGKATRTVSASEQLQDEMSEDEKVCYEQLQDKIHTSGQVLVSMVEKGTKIASGVSCGVGSPKDEGVKTRLYSPVYKPPQATASPQENNTTIATTISNSPASRHISPTLQHAYWPTLESSHPQLLALRSYIATAPMASPEMEKIQQLIVAAIDGDISLETNPDFDAQLEAILDRMMTDEAFLKGVIAFGISKLGSCDPLTMAESSLNTTGYSLTEHDAISPGSKFNMKTCTLEELKKEHSTTLSLTRKGHRFQLQLKAKCDKLQEKMKALTAERDYWKGVGMKMPDSKALVNSSAKWSCKSCGLVNDSWTDLEQRAPGKSSKSAKPASKDPGVLANTENTWAPTDYCRYCGSHKSGSQSGPKAESPGKRKLAHATEENGFEIFEDHFEDRFKRHCENIESVVKPLGRAIPNTDSFQVQLGGSPAAASGTELQQAPRTNTQKAGTQQSQRNDTNCFPDYLSSVSGTVADQQYFPNNNGTTPSEQYFPNGYDTIAVQQHFPTGNGTIAEQHHFPTGNDATGQQQHFPVGGGVATDQQYFPSSNGTISNQQSPLSGNGTTPGQQRPPSPDGTNSSDHTLRGDYDESTNSLQCAQAGNGTEEEDLFAEVDLDVLLGISQDPFHQENWPDMTPSLNTGGMVSAVQEKPSTRYPGLTTHSSAYSSPYSMDRSSYSPIEIDDNVPPISQADLDAINSIPVKQPYQPSAKPPMKSQRNSPNKVTKPGIKYDIRGNPIGTATLPTMRYRKLAPRTAKEGARMFPASAPPKDAAPQTTQHPNGG